LASLLPFAAPSLTALDELAENSMSGKFWMRPEKHAVAFIQPQGSANR
jgi:hypothetical protein